MKESQCVIMLQNVKTSFEQLLPTLGECGFAMRYTVLANENYACRN